MSPAELDARYAERLDAVPHAEDCDLARHRRGEIVLPDGFSVWPICSCDRELRQAALVRRMVKAGARFIYDRISEGYPVAIPEDAIHDAALALRPE